MSFSLASLDGRARLGPAVVLELVVAPRFFGGCLKIGELRDWDIVFVCVARLTILKGVAAA